MIAIGGHTGLNWGFAQRQKHNFRIIEVYTNRYKFMWWFRG